MRQRLLAATYEWYKLQVQERGPVGGFGYEFRTGTRGEQTGGVIRVISRGTIANDEAPQEVVLVNRPESETSITRVSGPFCVEATIPVPTDWQAGRVPGALAESTDDHGLFVDRMLEVLRRSPVLHVGGGRSITLKNLRPPAKSLSLSAEASVDATALRQPASLTEAVQEALEKNGRALPLSAKSVALVLGPEDGAVSEKLVYESAREANAKTYSHLYVIGFAIQPNARALVEKCAEVVGIPATYVQATPDLMMGDLLKNTRSSQIFSVCGLPEVRLRKTKGGKKDDAARYEVELLGLDVFDPATMALDHLSGSDVPAWFLDADYNGLCFHVCQAFFPRTSAWDDLKKALKGEYEDSLWAHLAGTVSAAFEAGEHREVAVKVIDDRGNELLVVKSLSEAEG